MRTEFDRPSDPVTITLSDDREYTLFYSHRDLKHIRDEMKLSFLKGTGFADVDEDKLPKLLWYGLRKHHPGLAIEVDGNASTEKIEDIMNGAASRYTLGRIVLAATGQDPSKNAQSSQAPEVPTPAA